MQPNAFDVAQTIYARSPQVLRIRGMGGRLWRRNVAKGARTGPWLQADYEVTDRQEWMRRGPCLYLVGTWDGRIPYVGISRNGLKHRWRTSPALDAETMEWLPRPQLFHSQCWKHIEAESAANPEAWFEVRSARAEELSRTLRELGPPLSAFAAFGDDEESIVASVERWLCNHANEGIASWNSAMTGRKRREPALAPESRVPFALPDPKAASLRSAGSGDARGGARAIRTPPGLGEVLDGLPRGDLQTADVLNEETLLAQDGDLTAYYAPFDHQRREARVVLLGITPGWTQTKLAYEAARDAWRGGADRQACIRAAKRTARFAGGMRRNLVGMLDGIGLPDALGVATSAELFEGDSDLVYSTSAIRYPVFRGGENYSGRRPALGRDPFLRTLFEAWCRPMLAELSQALLIPLGKSVEELVASAGLGGTILRGFPHPSPGNGHRVRQYAENRESLSRQVAEWEEAMREAEVGV